MVRRTRRLRTHLTASPDLACELTAPQGADRLVLAFHGHGDDPATLARLVRPAFDGAAIAAVRGPVPIGHGAAWYHGEPSATAPEPLGPPLGATLDASARLATALCETHGFDVDEVIVIGWSQGAAAALALGLRVTAGWRPRTVVALAGWLPNEPDVVWDFASAAATGIEVVLAHGSADEVVPVEQGRAVRRVLERNGVKVRAAEVAAAHDLTALLPAGLGALTTIEP